MQQRGSDIVDEALAGIEGDPEPETVGRVDAPDSETAEGDTTADTEASDSE
jgi:hypothetical protein